MSHPKTSRNPRGAGRPSKANHSQQNNARQFFMLEKTELSRTLMKAAHKQYIQRTGELGTDADVLRAALAVYSLGAKTE